MLKKILLVILLFFPIFIQAQSPELVLDTTTRMKARVIEVVGQETRNVPGTQMESTYQSIRAEILEGERKGEILTLEDDYLKLQKGQVFYVNHTVNSVDGKDFYAIGEPYRLPVVIFFILLFIVLVFAFGGIQGVRGLLSLAGSLLLILYILLPGILEGYSPILMSLLVSSLIVTVGSYITHGFNKTTSSAVVGMIATVGITGLLAYIAVQMGQLSGFSSDEAVYLNLDTQGSIDFVGLLLGGILIGLLGVLYDVAIGQAVSVEELTSVAPHLPRTEIFKRAVRIGREHIGALVNTLAIAYVGVSLPLLLLYLKSSTAPLSYTLNQEIFATEVLRTMIGSIGLVLAVPITTAIAVWILMRKSKEAVSPEKIKEEEEAIEHVGHHH